MLGMGLLGLMATPRQEDPQISVPMVDIHIQAPGLLGLGDGGVLFLDVGEVSQGEPVGA